MFIGVAIVARTCDQRDHPEILELGVDLVAAIGRSFDLAAIMRSLLQRSLHWITQRLSALVKDRHNIDYRANLSC